MGGWVRVSARRHCRRLVLLLLLPAVVWLVRVAVVVAGLRLRLRLSLHQDAKFIAGITGIRKLRSNG